ncbi:MAG: heparinase II/III family protein [Prevotella sp.]
MRTIVCFRKVAVTLTVAWTAVTASAGDSLMTAVRRNLEAAPKVRESYIKYGEQFAGKAWESPSARLFAEFRTNGNRTRYEQATFAKRRQLAALVMAEVAEGKGRFMGDIVDGLQSTMEETWWGIPAHYGTKVMRQEDQTVDLFNAETAGLLAWTRRALREEIDSFSPLLGKRIDSEIERRMLIPAVSTDYWWKKRAMNWNPWICSNWLACVQFCEHDPMRRKEALTQISQAMQCFFNAYPDDGGCDEGPTYWDRAAASLFDCVKLLEVRGEKVEGRGEKVEGRDYCTAQCAGETPTPPADAANHEAEHISTLYPLPSTLKNSTLKNSTLKKNPKLRRMASYSYSTYIADGYCLSFADSHGNRLVQQPNVMFPFALYLGDSTMAEFAAYVAKEKGFEENAAGIYDQSGNYPTLGRELVFLGCLDKFVATKPSEPMLADTWLPRLQIFTARRNGVFVGMKGGHNDESHNHNDVGSFVVYDSGQPLLIDPGVGEYTSKTFSSKRYEIWTMQSAYHNLPQINGCDQMAGKHFAARDVKRKKGCLTMDIAGAYPDSANVERWTRTVTVGKRGEIAIADSYKLKEWKAPTRLMLMAAVEPKEEKGCIRIGNRILHYDASQLDATIEPLSPMFDNMMRSMWQNGLWRIVLTVRGEKKEGVVKMNIK